MDITSKISYKKEAEILYKMYLTLGELKDGVIHGKSAFKEGDTTITINGKTIVVEYEDGTTSKYTEK